MNYQNTRALALLGNFLNERPDFIRPDEVRALTNLGTPEEQAVALLVASACGLDLVNNGEDKALFHTYLLPGFHRLSPAHYTQDSYYRCIHVPKADFGDFSLAQQLYRPYECFVCNDLKCGPHAEVLPQIGFFTQAFSYPAVLEKGRLWMSVTPNEIETMRGPIARARGKVLTYGLGLGYFAFHASEKTTVKEVTVVEHSPQAIALFTKYLLPLFPHAGKIRLIQADAFDFASREDISGRFNYIFVDLWRDVSDGLMIYKQFKKLEPPDRRIITDYWIEPTLRFYL